MLTPLYAAAAGATAAHPYNLEINGTDLIAKVPMESIQIEMAGPGTNGSMSFTIFDPDASVTVAEWDEVTFTEHAATRSILFGGFVQSVRFILWATTGRMIEVECVGYGVLLDKKIAEDVVVDYLADSPDYHSAHISDLLVSVVNRFGGRVTARTLGTGDSVTDANYGVSHNTSWWWWYDNVVEPFTIDGPLTLRAMVEKIASYGHYIGELDTPYPMVYWVDSAAMFRAHADTLALTPYGSWNPNRYTFDSGINGPHLTTTGTYRVTGLTYEREDTDRVSSVWVEGGDPAGTGWHRTPAPDRTGDLETSVSDSNSVSADDIAIIGGPVVGASATATVSGTVTVEAATPQDFWPGREVRLDFPAVGLVYDRGTYDESWRMTRVGIRWLSKTIREYEIGWGGSAPAPTLSNRQGRYATR